MNHCENVVDIKVCKEFYIFVGSYKFAMSCEYLSDVSGVASLDLILGHTFYNRPCLAIGMLVHTCIYIYGCCLKVQSMTNYC